MRDLLQGIIDCKDAPQIRMGLNQVFGGLVANNNNFDVNILQQREQIHQVHRKSAIFIQKYNVNLNHRFYKYIAMS